MQTTEISCCISRAKVKCIVNVELVTEYSRLHSLIMNYKYLSGDVLAQT